MQWHVAALVRRATVLAMAFGTTYTIQNVMLESNVQVFDSKLQIGNDAIHDVVHEGAFFLDLCRIVLIKPKKCGALEAFEFFTLHALLHGCFIVLSRQSHTHARSHASTPDRQSESAFRVNRRAS
jgi:hypothetical protein